MLYNKPTIIIDRTALAEIQWYVDRCKKEIGGLGKVVRQEDGSYFISKIYLLKQEVHSTETELDDDAVCDLLAKTHNDGHEGDLLFWWHSHVNMDVRWSGTDEDTIQTFGKRGLMIATVFNKKGDTRTALYAKGEGLSPDVCYDDIKLMTKTDIDTEALEKEFKEKVKEATYKHPIAHDHIMGGGNVSHLYGNGVADEVIPKHGNYGVSTDPREYYAYVNHDNVPILPPIENRYMGLDFSDDRCAYTIEQVLAMEFEDLDYATQSKFYNAYVKEYILEQELKGVGVWELKRKYSEYYLEMVEFAGEWYNNYDAYKLNS